MARNVQFITILSKGLLLEEFIIGTCNERIMINLVLSTHRWKTSTQVINKFITCIPGRLLFVSSEVVDFCSIIQNLQMLKKHFIRIMHIPVAELKPVATICQLRICTAEGADMASADIPSADDYLLLPWYSARLPL